MPRGGDSMINLEGAPGRSAPHLTETQQLHRPAALPGLQHCSAPAERDLFFSFQTRKAAYHPWTESDKAILDMGPEDMTFMGNDAGWRCRSVAASGSLPTAAAVRSCSS